MTGVRLSYRSRFLLQPSSDKHLCGSVWVMARGRRGVEYGQVELSNILNKDNIILVNKVAYVLCMVLLALEVLILTKRLRCCNDQTELH